jgi:hypothetical protein
VSRFFLFVSPVAVKEKCAALVWVQLSSHQSAQRFDGSEIKSGSSDGLRGGYIDPAKTYDVGLGALIISFLHTLKL